MERRDEEEGPAGAESRARAYHAAMSNCVRKVSTAGISFRGPDHVLNTYGHIRTENPLPY